MQKEGENLNAASESCWERWSLGSVAGVQKGLSNAGLLLIVLWLVVLIVMVSFLLLPHPPHPAPPFTQVTTYLHKDYNNLWIIKKQNTDSGNVVGN